MVRPLRNSTTASAWWAKLSTTACIELRKTLGWLLMLLESQWRSTLKSMDAREAGLTRTGHGTLPFLVVEPLTASAHILREHHDPLARPMPWKLIETQTNTEKWQV